MGLLEILNDPTVNRGLLEFGLRMLSDPRGGLGQAVGRSGLGALQGVQNFKNQQFQDTLQKRQLAQLGRDAKKQEQEAALDLLPGQFIRPATPEIQGNNPSAFQPAQAGSADLAGLAQALLAAPGGLSRGLGLSQSLAKQKTPLVPVAPGASLFDPNTNRAVFTSPKEKSLVSVAPGASVFDPNSNRSLFTSPNKPPGTNVTVNQTEETAEAKAVGKAFGDQFVELQQAGLKAGQTIIKLDRLSSLLQGVDTGKLTPAGTEVAALARSLGLNIDDKLDNKQAADALMKGLALESRNPSGGAGMPGALSDKDLNFLERMTPSLAKTPEGNRLIIETNRKLSQRSQQVAEAARKYRAKNGKLDGGFFEELKEFSDANPLFDDTAQPTTSQDGFSIRPL